MQLYQALLLLAVASCAAAQLQRGQRCQPGFRHHPKFRQSRSCDSSKGLDCLFSYNPQFGAAKDGSKFCECSEGYYYDEASDECRIQIGEACDPSETSDGWNKLCPENGFCSTNVGRYGPRGAMGMCRCKPGFIVSSTWYTLGGGTTCERDQSAQYGSLDDFYFNLGSWMANGNGLENPGD